MSGVKCGCRMLNSDDIREFQKRKSDAENAEASQRTRGLAATDAPPRNSACPLRYLRRGFCSALPADGRQSMPDKGQARLARVASAGDGAVTVSTSPAENAVAVPIVKLALVAPAANTIVPRAVPFLAIVKVAVAAAAAPQVL